MQKIDKIYFDIDGVIRATASPKEDVMACFGIAWIIILVQSIGSLRIAGVERTTRILRLEVSFRMSLWMGYTLKSCRRIGER